MRHKKGNDVHGWLVVDKPAGMGSTDVVNLTRRLFNAKKTAIPELWIRLRPGFCRLLLEKRQN